MSIFPSSLSASLQFFRIHLASTLSCSVILDHRLRPWKFPFSFTWGSRPSRLWKATCLVPLHRVTLFLTGGHNPGVRYDYSHTLLTRWSFPLPPLPLSAAPCLQAGHGQLGFAVTSYSDPCSRQSNHSAVNPSSGARLTQALTAHFIYLSFLFSPCPSITPLHTHSSIHLSDCTQIKTLAWGL